jgi:hypothetical protein
MKSLLLLLMVATQAAAGPSQAPTTPTETLMHTETAFSLVVHLPYAETASLFGPEGERAWAGKHWDPQFIYPKPAHDVEGSVFTIKHGSFSAVWVNTVFDVRARHFKYVYFIPDLMVTTIDVRFKLLDQAITQVDVVYARTAVTLDGNEHVVAMTEGDESAGQEWQQAIDSYLAAGKTAGISQ